MCVRGAFFSFIRIDFANYNDVKFIGVVQNGSVYSMC